MKIALYIFMSIFAEEINTEDNNTSGAITLYIFDRNIEGGNYGGHIPARSWQEAQSLVATFGGVVIGQSVEIQFTDKICVKCKESLTISTEAPEPIDVDPWD